MIKKFLKSATPIMKMMRKKKKLKKRIKNQKFNFKAIIETSTIKNPLKLDRNH
jgi:hypothetical protein